MKKLKIVFLAILLFTGITSCNKEEEKEQAPNLDTATIQKLLGEWEIVGYIGTSAQTINLSTLDFGEYDNCSNNVNTKIKLNADFKSNYYQLRYGTGAICTLDPPIDGNWTYSNGQFSESTFFTSQSTTGSILEITTTTLIIKSKLNDSGFNRIFKLSKI
jgi:hypothetical protein